MPRFVDLCCGIGGFHQAMMSVCEERGLNAECVFASDNDIDVANIYSMNYGIEAYYDLANDTTHDLIDETVGEEGLDFLFAGFPCQPFSKAGNQGGFAEVTKGTVFFHILRVIQRHKPKCVLLENVRNLKKHDDGKTWKTIHDLLVKQGYKVDDVILSPNKIGNTPALRDRMFILAYRNDLVTDENMQKLSNNRYETIKTSIYSWGKLEKGLKAQYFEKNQMSDLEPYDIKTINMWNDLFHRLKENKGYLVSPLWPHYFDRRINVDDCPDWKKVIIERNRVFYEDNKVVYDRWYNEHIDHFASLTASDKKFEWNAGDEINDIWEGIIQFRPSGVRVKRPDCIPTLVAINQTPIIGIEKRYLKPREISKLYGFRNLNFGNQAESTTYKQLGNTVSVDVVKFLLRHMMDLLNLEADYNG